MRYAIVIEQGSASFGAYVPDFAGLRRRRRDS